MIPAPQRQLLGVLRDFTTCSLFRHRVWSCHGNDRERDREASGELGWVEDVAKEGVGERCEKQKNKLERRVIFHIPPPCYQMALPATMIVVFPMFLFSGLILNFDDTPVYLIWFVCVCVCARARTRVCTHMLACLHAHARTRMCVHVVCGACNACVGKQTHVHMHTRLRVCRLQYISLFYYSFSLLSVNQWSGFGSLSCTTETMQFPLSCPQSAHIWTSFGSKDANIA